jgi:hypothetical protein
MRRGLPSSRDALHLNATRAVFWQISEALELRARWYEARGYEVPERILDAIAVVQRALQSGGY